MKTAIFIISPDSCQELSLKLKQEFADAVYPQLSQMEEVFPTTDQILFVGAMGICVRSIAPCLKNKYKDPAVICLDTTGKYVIPVVSGHVGGANELAKRVAHILGAEAVITTQSDRTGLWALDTLASKYQWKVELKNGDFNHLIALFVNKKPTALLLEAKDSGCDYLEKSLPAHVQLFHAFDKIDLSAFELIIIVGPYQHETQDTPTLYYHPAVLHLGMGCRKQCNPTGIPAYMASELKTKGLSPLSLKSISTITLKKDEPLLESLSKSFGCETHIYEAEQLEGIEVPNPSAKVKEVTGVSSVSESTALKASSLGKLLVEKQKGCLTEGNDFTFAVALDRSQFKKGHIEIVGAGPGDPELISVRGKRMLEQADLVLYAGSLVPYELTQYAPEHAVIRSSAGLDLEEQFALMKECYDQGGFVVRLHTGDPCIYGAIQEQMAFFDEYDMEYHITPGISSFQAAAAALKSQFTIPEKVQSIILTRGEGRTPMPEKEKLHKLAQSQSTMCIYLSAGIVEEVQRELLQAYPAETPVAACYKLTWKEERIYRGQLKDLAKIVHDNHLTLTTLLVVGESIDNRKGLSKLYSSHFTHLFREAKD